jgi:hypothetical protein
MNGFEDKRSLKALNVRLDRNLGLPTSRKAQGNGVPVVLVGATPYQGAWESQVQGKGGQAGKKGWKSEARCPCLKGQADQKISCQLESRVR